MTQTKTTEERAGMLRRLTKHLNPSTAIAILALILATTGGAFAASSPGKSGSGSGSGSGGGKPNTETLASAARAKSKAGPRGKTGPKGPAGAKGATGPAGAAGAAGAAGGKGETGPQGPAGKTGVAGRPGEPGEPGTPGAPGAAGKEGSPWTDGGTLPEGSIETGTWSANFAPTEATTLQWISLSFPIHLAAAFSDHTFYVTLEQQEKAGGKKDPAECIVKGVEGSAEEPVAASGSLCMYEGVVEAPEAGRDPFGENAGIVRPGKSGGSVVQGVGVAGALAGIEYPGGAEAKSALVWGSWAVGGCSPSASNPKEWYSSPFGGELTVRERDLNV
jgi:hypothetical protein